MGERRKINIPQRLKDKYGDKFMIWSYSRLSTFHNCKHEYYLGRIKKVCGENNIYGICGTYSHDILEDFYNNRIEYDNMADKFAQDFLEVELSEYKFSSDEEKNAKYLKSYRDNIIHFFNNHDKVEHNVLTEREIWIEVGDNVFIGYVDAIHKEDDYYIITDYKTSSISEFTGSKLHEKQKQLLIYALGLHQLGVPLDKIKIRWNFLKYTNIKINHMINVTYTEKDKIKTSCVYKNEWVSKVKTQLKKDIAEYYTDLKPKEIKAILDKCIEDNNLNSLPSELVDKYILSDVIKIGERYKWVNNSPLLTQLKKDLKTCGVEQVEIETLIIDCVTSNSLEPLSEYIDLNNYQLSDCYIYGEVNKSNVDEMVNEFIEDIKNIKLNGREECNWNIDGVDKSKEFYCNVLCGYKKHCKYYSEYLDKLKSDNMFNKPDEYDDIFKELENL